MVPEIVIEVVESMKQQYSIQLILSCLKVSKSTYYRWKKQYQQTALDDITIRIQQLCKDNNYTYGYRKITYLINKEVDYPVNHKRVQRIMQSNGWSCRIKQKKQQRLGKPYYLTTNQLNRQFKSTAPLRKLVTDITYLPFGTSMLYLSSIMDLYNGEIVAYSIGEKQDTSLVLHTLNQLDLEKGCLLHSDQGSVYTSRDYYIACNEKSITRSMSRKATPSDNACIECFHSSLKCEAFYPSTEHISSNTIVIDIVKNYIKNYNENRIQQKLGYLSPVQFREQAA